MRWEGARIKLEQRVTMDLTVHAPGERSSDDARIFLIYMNQVKLSFVTDR